MHQNILKYRAGRFFYISVLLIGLSTIIFATQIFGKQPANGGTWQGYVLGSIAALLIVWLMVLGKRKRDYRSGIGSLQAWVSAHVYLGFALLFIATLHSAAQVGWNIHTLAYLFMLLVILSGIFGTYIYMRYPTKLARNKMGKSRDAMFSELSSVDQSLRVLSRQTEGDTQRVIDSAITRTSIGGGVLAQLFGLDRSKVLDIDQPGKERYVSNKNQLALIERISEQLPRARKKGLPTVLHDVLKLCCRRQVLLSRIRRDVSLQAWVKVWLYVHIPFSFALIIALVAHIFSVFYYW